jgi:hypothetical protein
MSFLYIGCPPDEAKRCRALLRERDLVSYMNDTKWRELCVGIDALPFPPPYQSKRLYKDDPLLWADGYTPPFWGDWARTPEAALGIFTQWVRITPRYSKHRGKLIAPEIFDCSGQLQSLLKSLSIPHIQTDGVLIIHGHAQSWQVVSS